MVRIYQIVGTYLLIHNYQLIVASEAEPMILQSVDKNLKCLDIIRNRKKFNDFYV